MNIKNKIKSALNTPIEVVSKKLEEIVEERVNEDELGARHAFDIVPREDGGYDIVIIKYNDKVCKVVSRSDFATNKVSAIRKLQVISSDKIMNKIDMNNSYLGAKDE